MSYVVIARNIMTGEIEYESDEFYTREEAEMHMNEAIDGFNAGAESMEYNCETNEDDGYVDPDDLDWSIEKS